MIKYLMALITWLAFFNTYAQSPAKMTMREKKLAKIAAEHKTWDRCFVITDKSDTIFGRMKPGLPKESMEKVFSPLMDNVVFFSFPNDSECNFFPFAIKQLYDYDAPEGWKKYVTLQLRDQYAIASKAFCLAHVVEEGKCTLYSFERLVAMGTSGKMVLFYYVLYNNQLQAIAGAGSPLVHMGVVAFRRQCQEIFADCPALAAQAASKEFYYEDLPDMVKQYNNCFKSKSSTAPQLPH